MTFEDMLRSDAGSVFGNTAEFAEEMTYKSPSGAAATVTGIAGLEEDDLTAADDGRGIKKRVTAKLVTAGAPEISVQGKLIVNSVEWDIAEVGAEVTGMVDVRLVRWEPTRVGHRTARRPRFS